MKLNLTNFGIHSQQSFEFPDTGLILISGSSGKGKTTILRAINYVFTGEGTKLPTIGEKKCVASLEYTLNKIVYNIQRSNSPSRLTLKIGDNFYEDDEAQSIINEIIGKNFDIAGYIQQKGENSFLCMNPSEKLRFLERIAFSDVPIEEFKEKAKEMVNTEELKLYSLQGQLKNLRENPIKKPDEFMWTISQINEKIEFLSNEIKKTIEQQELYEKKKVQFAIYNQKKIHLQNLIESIKFEEEPVVKTPNGEEEDLILIQIYDEYIREKKNIEDLEQYQKKHQEDIEKLQREIEVLNKQIENLEDTSAIEEYEQYLKIYYQQQEYKKLQSEFSEKRYTSLEESLIQEELNLRNLIQSKDSKKCPKCSSQLRIVGENLEVFDSMCQVYSISLEKELKEKIQNMKKEIQSLQNLRTKIKELNFEDTEEIDLNPDEVSEEIERLKNVQKESNLLTKKYEEIHRDLKRVQSDSGISKISEKISNFRQKEVPTVPSRTKFELEKTLQNIRDSRREHSRIVNENNRKTARKEELENEYLNLLIVSEPNEEEINEIKNKLEYYHSEQIKYSQLQKDYEAYKKCLSIYNAYIKNEKNLKEQLEDCEKYFTLAKKFKESVLTAEMLSLNSIIEEINSHLSTYLSVFFPENPLTLELSLFKANDKTKIVKNQVNIQVGYRGVITDLNTLSGGEKDRVNLAFTLALAEIFNIPFLMFDETLSSLDRETTENIIEHIQKDSKCILIVAHQVSLGLFDHVVHI